jgi:hypothetical protein
MQSCVASVNVSLYLAQIVFLRRLASCPTLKRALANEGAEASSREKLTVSPATIASTNSLSPESGCIIPENVIS